MRNLKQKFKNKITFVKPLYKKVKPLNSIPNKSAFVDVDNTIKLCGNAINVKRHIKSNGKSLKPYKNTFEKCLILPSQRNRIEHHRTDDGMIRNANAKRQFSYEMIGIVESHQQNEFVIKNVDKETEAVSIYKVPDHWLRVYPAQKLADESVPSVFFRCLMCQFGLASFLILWTLLWVFVINHFEAPFETKVSLDFKKQQNQLVIDLATELRQITPVSPKWRSAIESRIETERQMTVKAVGRGARLHPGHYWDIAGSFLFTVYVLTALGFGAPVPQTLEGRTSTLVYAIIAVPMHFYLMLNLSTCVVVHVEGCMKRLKSCFGEKQPFEDKNTLDITKDSQAHSRNSELMKSSPLRTRMLCIVGILFCGRCVPLAILLYYVVGVVIFGVARSKDALEVVMFPLEFTTSGGLENVECYIRSLYAIYVEGAMILLSCALATLRRCSSGSMNKMTDQYRLFVNEHMKDQ